MAIETVTYSNKSNAWSSFWSFIPDWMDQMNSSFYTWKNGSLYKHNSNTTRNKFYDTMYPSQITTIFNQEPLENKMFKTVSIDGTHAWDATITTDLSSGEIAESYFKEKEGEWYAFIRRPDDGSYDTLSMSTQGIGSMLSYNALVLTFSFNINSMLSNGDKLYVVSGGSLVLLGTVASHTTTTITISSIGATLPAPGDMIVFVKNSMAESFGARGYYMEVTFEKTLATEVEIFSVSSSVFKSNP